MRSGLTGDLADYWPLRGDAQDHSGHSNHARVHGSGAAEGNFDGRGNFIEIRTWTPRRISGAESSPCRPAKACHMTDTLAPAGST